MSQKQQQQRQPPPPLSPSAPQQQIILQNDDDGKTTTATVQLSSQQPPPQFFFPFFETLTPIFEKAYSFLDSFKMYTPGIMPIVVFDIDNTVLFADNHSVCGIAPVCQFFQKIWTNLHHIGIVFLTARSTCSSEFAMRFSEDGKSIPQEMIQSTDNRRLTIEQLRGIGLWPSADDDDTQKRQKLNTKTPFLFLMPLELYSHLPFMAETPEEKLLQYEILSNFKDSIRRSLREDLKMQVVLNIGDQKSDHHGQHYLHHICFKFSDQSYELTHLSTSF